MLPPPPGESKFIGEVQKGKPKGSWTVAKTPDSTPEPERFPLIVDTKVALLGSLRDGLGMMGGLKIFVTLWVNRMPLMPRELLLPPRAWMPGFEAQAGEIFTDRGHRVTTFVSVVNPNGNKCWRKV